jgi:hypothetical protein
MWTNKASRALGRVMRWYCTLRTAQHLVCPSNTQTLLKSSILALRHVVNIQDCVGKTAIVQSVTIAGSDESHKKQHNTENRISAQLSPMHLNVRSTYRLSHAESENH